jgi:MEMO1 family protein
MKTRIPAVAGTFYPATEAALNQQVSILFEKAKRSPESKVAALIVPHAGYIFSGEVAASAYAKLNRNAQYKNIFLIGASHHKYLNGVSIYPEGCYTTPLGEVKINDETTQELLEKHNFVYYDKEADSEEHCLEVQLPFLQFWLLNKFQIVPLLLGSDEPFLCNKLAEALIPWFNDENLFVISTDFSHYPSYESAVKLDAETAEAIISNDCNKLKDSCNRNKRSFPSNTLTALCGASAVQTLLNLTYDQPDISFDKILYKNSGDYPHGDKHSVVGYWAISVNRNG